MVAAAHHPLIELLAVSYQYPDGHRAIEHVDLQVLEGDTLALVGPNGAGKTTLIKHLNGILTPTVGEVRYEGQPVQKGNVARVRAQIGVVFQDPDDQLFSATVFDDVLFGLLNQGLDEQEAFLRAEKALQRVGLGEYGNKAPHRLSYGQRKRAALATVLAMEPRIVVLDEPTSYLDPSNQRVLAEILSSLSKTLIVVSHDLPFLYGICRRALVLGEGQVQHDFSMRKLVSHAHTLREHGLDFTFHCTCCDAGDHEHSHEEAEEGTERLPTVANAVVPSVSAGRPTVAAGSSAVSVLEVLDYAYQYADGTPALQGVNFALQKNETLAIVGENGAGKSTLAKCLAGISVGSGRIRVGRDPVDPRHLEQLRSRVGLVFQDPSDQLFCPTVAEDVAFGPRQMGLPVDEIERRVADALAAVYMTGWEQKSTFHMSMGEKKRVAVATILSMKPEILVLDEPTAHLDPESIERLVAVIRSLPGSKILISHDLSLIYELCQRVVVMRQGTIVSDQEVGLFRRDRNLVSQFGLDYTFKCSCCREIRSLQRESSLLPRES